jgi:4-hydroxybenzoate polyprenyltransferase
MAGGLFRLMGGLGRNMVVANTFGSFSLLLLMVLGGFILTRGTVTINSCCDLSTDRSTSSVCLQTTFTSILQIASRNGGYGATGYLH